MGGTNILGPLKEALKLDPPVAFTKHKGYKKMIFILTDGETSDAHQCFKLVSDEKPENTLIHTFGVGDDCDKNFVK
jgi:uncharacterized protein YegL